MFIKNCWYVAAWDYELIDGALLGRTILNEKVLLYKGKDNTAYAIDDRCCHRGAALSLGRLEGNCVRCMYHGLLFDNTGACVQIPGQENIPPSLKVRSYPVETVGRLVWIWMGDKALANKADIPDFPYLVDPQWHGMPGYMYYKANYQLITDNLSDFNHVAYVHTNTLGGSESYVTENTSSPLEKLENGFKLTKWHMNSELPPFVRKFVKHMHKVDRWNTVKMLVPGFFFLESGFSPAGNGIEKGNQEGAISFRNFQAMTPETENTSHFFWVYMHNQTEDRDQISRSLSASILEGFYEDKTIIEKQQEVLNDDPTFPLRAIAADAPLSHLRWIVDQRIKKESQVA